MKYYSTQLFLKKSALQNRRMSLFLHLLPLMIVLPLMLHRDLKALLGSELQILLYHQGFQNILPYREDADRNELLIFFLIHFF